MPVPHLVRYGALGHVGRFSSADAVRFPRHTRVVCRTTRGLEIGEVLSACNLQSNHENDTNGVLLRAMTVEDDLLQARLERQKQAAFAVCDDTLKKRGISVVLMDVEHLFDGKSLFFYFLGDVPNLAESVTHELAELYDTTIQFRRFAETLTEGCGPGCGTENAENGCGIDCGSCAIAGACKSTS